MTKIKKQEAKSSLLIAILGLLVVILLLGLLFFAIAKPGAEKIVWRSSPKGDFVEDLREPDAVCQALQEQYKLQSCKLLTAKESFNNDECADGMSIAGCFACKFSCPN